jgi:Fic family protein
LKKAGYTPPYKTTSIMIDLISKISETLGRFSFTHPNEFTPKLRRENRIRTIHSTLAIENNTLTLDQVTAVINGKRILGIPREIQEVKNAFTVYETLKNFNPASEKDFLKAHKFLMSSLLSDAGYYRMSSVGIIQGKNIIHLPPPAKRVPVLMSDLFHWLKTTDSHPLIVGSVFHYELEFIHPFSDGNGRMGRLWQTLIISKWKPLLAYLPVETIIRARQEDYYRILAECDEKADSTIFIEFILKALRDALLEIAATDQDTDQVTDQVKKLIKVLGRKTLTAGELMQLLKLSHKPTFRKNYLHPAMNNGYIEMNIPDKPNSRFQKYSLTSKGMEYIFNNRE